MGLFGKKKRKPEPEGLSREEALLSRPVKSEWVELEEGPGGAVRLRYPLEVRPWFAKYAERFGRWDGSPLVKRIELDEIGAWTWERIDGKRTVGEMVELLAAEYKLHPKEAELSLTRFLLELGRRGLIGMA